MSDSKEIPKKILELNPDHPILRNLAAIYEKNSNDPFIEKTAVQLFESALLLDGYLNDPHQLVSHIHEMLSTATDLYAEKETKEERSEK